MSVLAQLEELVMDYPKFGEIVGKLLGRCVAVDCAAIGWIHPLSQTGDDGAVGRFLTSRHGKQLVTSMLCSMKQCGMAEDKIREGWKASGLEPSDWLLEEY